MLSKFFTLLCFLAVTATTALAQNLEFPHLVTPYFPACSEQKLVANLEYDRLLRALHPEDLRKQKILPILDEKFDKELFSNHQAGQFFELLRKDVQDYLAISGFHAQMLSACVRFVSDNDKRWFETKYSHELGIDVEAFRPFCKTQIDHIRKTIQDSWPKMRVALALSAPRFREDRILLNDTSTQIRENPQHPFDDPWMTKRVAKMPPLSPEERSQALQIYRQWYEQMKMDVHQEFAKRNKVPAKMDEISYMQGRIHPFQQLQKNTYWAQLEEVPLLAFLTSGNPTDRELTSAFARIEENAMTTLKQLKDSGNDKPELYGTFSTLIDQLLVSHPEFCGIAHGWMAQLKRKQQISLLIRGTISVLTTAISFSGQGKVITGINETVGILMSATYAYGTRVDFNQSYTQSFSSVVNQRGIANFERLENDKKKLLIITAFLPIHAYAGYTTGSHATNATRQFIQATRIARAKPKTRSEQ